MELPFARQAIDGEGGLKWLLMNSDWFSSQNEGPQRRNTGRKHEFTAPATADWTAVIGDEVVAADAVRD